MAKAPETSSVPKDLNQKQDASKDVEFDRDKLASDDESERNAEINKRVGPQVENVNTRGAEFPIPEDKTPAAMPADQEK